MNYQQINDRFQSIAQANTIFRADVRDLWKVYLNTFQEPRRQEHNCSACRAFIERYGALVTISEQGDIKSAVWNDEENLQQEALAHAVENRRPRINGVFFSSKEILGKPQTGKWSHLYLNSPRIVGNAFRADAEERHKFETVMRALKEFGLSLLNEAVRVLESDSLYRAHHVIAQGIWLRDLQNSCNENPSRKANLVWRAIATAPSGFCHPRASMLGTLLEDIERGLPFEEVSRKFANKMHPLLYQRPQAAPTEGSIKVAEKLFVEMGLEPALHRRYAQPEELCSLWLPALKQKSQQSGIFSHLARKHQDDVNRLDIPAQKITWEKFHRTVGAERMDILVPARGNYAAIVTAVHADAPQLFQWPHPFSWYVWNGGSTAEQFNIKGKQWHEVTNICLSPAKWSAAGTDYNHHGNSIIFIIAGAKETRGGAGAAIFPETLRAELRPVRSVIEAYSKSAKIAGLDEPHAAGLMLSKQESSKSWNQKVRVWNNGVPTDYLLDRWE